MAPLTGLCFDEATNASGWWEERGGNYMYVGRRKEWRWERGHVHMMSAVGGGEGGTPKADVVREVA